MTTIDERIAAAEALAAQLEDACRAVAEAHGGATDEPAVQSAQRAGARAKEAADELRACHKKLAYARRPKGPMVVFEYRGYEKREPWQAEVIRRTESSVFVVWPGTTYEQRYRLTDGHPANRPSSFSGYWRIAPAELERILAMPVGENEVSRALRKLEAKR